MLPIFFISCLLVNVYARLISSWCADSSTLQPFVMPLMEFCCLIQHVLAKDDQYGDANPTHDRYENKDQIAVAKLDWLFKPKLLRGLVSPILPHPLLHTTLLQLVEPVVDEAKVF